MITTQSASVCFFKPYDAPGRICCTVTFRDEHTYRLITATLTDWDHQSIIETLEEIWGDGWRDAELSIGRAIERGEL